MEARNLSLAPSDRRGGERNSLGSKIFALSDGKDVFDIDLINLAHGEVVFKSSQPLSLAKNYHLLHKEEKALLSHWHFSFMREEEGSHIYSFVDEDVKNHYRLVKDYEPHMFLNASTYRFFYEEKESDANELGLLFARLKECASYIQVTATLADAGFKETLRFDFSSERKELDVVDFETANVANFTKGMKYKFQFNFLSVAYAFEGVVTDVDTDFNLISVEFPHAMLATTARIFLRHKCEEEVVVLFGEKKIKGLLKNISISGALIEMSEPFLLPKGMIAKLEYKEQSVSFAVIESSQNILRLSFEEVRENLLLVRKMILDISSDKIIVREPSNYDKFIELYKKVGYAPAENVEEWERLTREAWREQDEKFPGGCVGDPSFSLCCSFHPFSKDVLLGHSWAMLRNESAANALYRVMLTGYDGLSLYGTTKYLLAFKKVSTFTRRFYLTISNLKTKNNIDNLVCKVSKPAVACKALLNNIKINEVSCLDKLLMLGDNCNTFLNVLKQNNEDILGEVTYKAIYLDNEFLGLIVITNGMRFSSAANLFQRMWIFLEIQNDSLEVAIADSLRMTFPNATFMFFREDRKSYSEIESEFFSEVDWYLLERSSVYETLNSMSLVTYALVRKYGDSFLDDLFAV